MLPLKPIPLLPHPLLTARLWRSQDLSARDNQIPRPLPARSSTRWASPQVTANNSITLVDARASVVSLSTVIV